MKLIRRKKRDRDIFLYKTGYESGIRHSIFETAIHTRLSISRVNAILKNYKDKILELVKDKDIPTIAQELEISTQAIERVLSEHRPTD